MALRGQIFGGAVDGAPPALGQGHQELIVGVVEIERRPNQRDGGRGLELGLPQVAIAQLPRALRDLRQIQGQEPDLHQPPRGLDVEREAGQGQADRSPRALEIACVGEHLGQTEPAAALGAFGFAMASNHVFMALAPMVLLAPWAWSTASLRPRASTVPALILWALLLAPSALDVAQSLFQRGDHGGQASRLSEALGLFVPGARETILYFDPRVTPRSWALLCLLGLGVALWRPVVPFVVVAVAWLVTEVPLGGQVPLDGGYPTRYVHGFASHFFASTFAALGAVIALDRARKWWPVAAVVMAVAALLPWPLSRESVAFARERRPLSLEARAVSSAFDHLPPCDVIVVPPEIQDDMGCAHRGSDPVEAIFQSGELRWVYQRRGLRPPQVVPANIFSDEQARGRRVLFYEGSVYHTFIPCESRERRIPASLERPLLTRFRARFTLTPARTFTVTTAQHRFAELRVMADRVPSLTLGFYWLRPR